MTKLKSTGFETLPCALTSFEHQDRARQLGEVLRDIDAHEARMKRDAKAAKDALETLKVQASKLATVVRTETEDREVEVRYEPELGRWVVETYRVDTGELVGSRPMTPDERASAAQGRLFEYEASVGGAGQWAAEQPKSFREAVDTVTISGRGTKVSHGFAGEPLKPVGQWAGQEMQAAQTFADAVERADVPLSLREAAAMLAGEATP